VGWLLFAATSVDFGAFQQSLILPNSPFFTILTNALLQLAQHSILLIRHPDRTPHHRLMQSTTPLRFQRVVPAWRTSGFRSLSRCC